VSFRLRAAAAPVAVALAASLALAAASPPDATAGDGSGFDARLRVHYTHVGGTPERAIIGPDGNPWINDIYCCEFGNPGGPVSRLANGDEQEFGLGDSYGITAGPDGNLWFTDNHANQVGYMELSPGNPVTRFELPSQPDGRGVLPWDITTGPDGNLWTTLNVTGEVARITPAGAVTRFPLRPQAFRPSPTTITPGPDNSLWIAGEQGAGGMLARITTDGKVRVYDFARRFPTVRSVVEGPGRRIWFSYLNGVGSIGSAGKPALYALPKFFDHYDAELTGATTGITVGPDRNLWIAVTGAAGTKSTNAIMRLTPGGRYTYFPLRFKPFINRGFELVTRPSTKTIFFTQPESGLVGRFRPPAGHCDVPELIGRPAQRAASLLEKARCSLGALSGPLGPHAKVVSQRPSAGRKFDALTHVSVRTRGHR